MEFGAFASILQRENATLEMTNADGDKFRQGIVTMRLIERLVVAIKDVGAGVKSDDFCIIIKTMVYPIG